MGGEGFIRKDATTTIPTADLSAKGRIPRSCLFQGARLRTCRSPVIISSVSVGKLKFEDGKSIVAALNYLVYMCTFLLHNCIIITCHPGNRNAPRLSLTESN